MYFTGSQVFLGVKLLSVHYNHTSLGHMWLKYSDHRLLQLV